LCQLDAGVAEVVRCLAELRKAVSPLRSAPALQIGYLGASRPRLPEAQAPRVHGNRLDTLSGRAALLKPLHRYGGLSADKRSQLAQLALLWSTSSCVNWMRMWRMCYAAELDA
jgi:hypothetical protein